MSSEWTQLKVRLMFIVDEINQSAAFTQDEINKAGLFSVLQ